MGKEAVFFMQVVVMRAPKALRGLLRKLFHMDEAHN
jgi:hypothetical protein